MVCFLKQSQERGLTRFLIVFTTYCFYHSIDSEEFFYYQPPLSSDILKTCYAVCIDVRGSRVLLQ